jgi:hypothetical protein
MLLEEERAELFQLFPESSILTLISLVEKFTLATTLCTWSPNLAHLLSVISMVRWHQFFRDSSSQYMEYIMGFDLP